MKRCQAETYCKSFNEERSKCHEYCIGYVQLQNIYSMSNMPKRYQYAMPLIPPTEDRDAFLFLRDFQLDVVRHVEEGHGLFIHSSTKGNGKTSWSCKIMNEYFRHVAMTNNLRCRGLFVNVPDFLDQLRDNMDDKEPNEELEDLKNHIKTADIVIWDDIGTENPSKWVRQTLYKFINYRESNGKTQIFTSNIPLADLSAEDYLGERVVDRIKGQCEIVRLSGQSKREATWGDET
jgi:DNA replication protein DnaC